MWEVAARQTHPFLDDQFFTRQRADIPNAYLPKARTYVATANDMVVGFTSVVRTEVAALFVDPAFQRRGFGRALLDHVKPHCPRLTLEVFEANLTARAFYHAYGFREYGTRIHEEAREKLLCMALDGPT